LQCSESLKVINLVKPHVLPGEVCLLCSSSGEFVPGWGADWMAGPWQSEGGIRVQKRRNLFRRGSVPIIWRSVVCGVRDAPWEWGGGAAAETPQAIAEYKRNTSETLANNTRLAGCPHAGGRPSGGLWCRGWRGLEDSVMGWDLAGRRKRAPRARLGGSTGHSTALTAQTLRIRTHFVPAPT
jgi:hypothetical protein